MTAQTGASATHLLEIREGFVRNLWRGVLAVTVIAAPISISRAFYTGWLAMYTVHLVVLAIAILVFLLQRRMSLNLRASGLLLLFWIMGLPGLFTMGFPAMSVWWLVLSCLVAGTVFPIRVGIVLGVATLLVIVIAGSGFVSGALSLTFDPRLFLRQPAAWAALLLVTGAFTFIVLRSTWLYNKAVVDLLEQVSVQRDRIETLAVHDHLTGLPVAQLAEDRIHMAIHAARRTGRKVALLFIDLDEFKAVNDTFGHEAGNEVLRQVAARMKASIRAEDTIARVGGDELLAVIGNLTEASLGGMVAEKLIRTICAPVEFDGKSVTIGASIGIAVFPDDSADSTELRRLADRAMYVAKKTGKNRYSYAQTPGAIPTVVVALDPAALQTDASSPSNRRREADPLHQ